MNRSTHIPILKAARQIGVTPSTMRKRCDRAGVVTELDPVDGQFRLIPRDVRPMLAKAAEQQIAALRSGGGVS